MPRDRDELLALAERCEKAEVPDRELDGDIAEGLVLVPGWAGRSRDNPKWATWSCGRDYWDAPNFTASLDAAMSLVPEGSAWSVNDPANSDGSKSVFGHSSRCHAWVAGSPNEHDYAVTPALALCAAALRAHASSETPT